tara:strand:+ start:143 stop:406 length:264 start_codon:yes stop_codon:yes gene_type:complete
MAKVNKAYSLDLETIQLIENYTHGGINSRSALVNNAIKWYIRGDIDELVQELEFNKKILKDMKIARETRDEVLPKTRSWWRRLLGLN